MYSIGMDFLCTSYGKAERGWKRRKEKKKSNPLDGPTALFTGVATAGVLCSPRQCILNAMKMHPIRQFKNWLRRIH